MKLSVAIGVNGRPYEREVEPRLLLVHFIRDSIGLTGTKIGCDTSQCGSCTVLIDGVAVKSCTCLAVQADGVGHHNRRPCPGGRLTRSGSVLEQARSAVRILYAGHDPGGARAAAHRNPSVDRADPARPRRQHVPLHRLPEHRPRGACRGGATGEVTPAAAMRTRIFGSRHPAPRRPAAHHRCGALHRRPHAARHGARGDAAQPARARAHPTHRHQPRAKAAPGVVAVFTGADIDGCCNPTPCAWLLPNAN